MAAGLSRPRCAGGVLLAALLCWVGCGERPKPAQGAKYTLGAVLELNGKVENFGRQCQNGMKLALEDLKQKKGPELEVVYMDNNSSPEQSSKAFTELVEVKGVLGVIGATISSDTRAMKELANKLQVPLLTPSATNVQLTKDTAWLFRVCWHDEFQGTVCAQFALNHLKAKRVAIVVNNGEDYARGLAVNFKENFVKGGGTVVEELTYAGGDIVFAPQIERLKTLNVDAVFCPGYREAALLVKQAREAGFSKPFLGGDGYDDPQFGQVAGPAAGTGVFFCNHAHPDDKDPRVQEFVLAYKARYSEPPGAMSFLGYDAVLLMHDAITRAAAKGAVTRTSLRDALLATKDLPLVTGTITIGPDHEVRKRAIVAEYNPDGTQKFVTQVPPP